VLFEKAPHITEVGAGLSLWSNAMIALRRLGLEAAALRAGSVIERTRTFLSIAKSFGSIDFAAHWARRREPLPSACTAPLFKVFSSTQRSNMIRDRCKLVENAPVSKRMRAELPLSSPTAQESAATS
jgi:2-polyprenyl-6-methoxyphenol hydroxylase-like FAD-dependent oxidoreductase